MNTETTRKTPAPWLAMLLIGSAAAACAAPPPEQGSAEVAGASADLRDGDNDGHDDYNDSWRFNARPANGAASASRASASSLSFTRRNVCPVVQASAVPASLKIGASTDLRGFATDTDGPRFLVYKWIVSPVTLGTIVNPTSKRTTFKCLKAGVAHLTFSAYDGACTQLVNLDVQCNPLTTIACGDGAKNGNETCDNSSPNAADKCPTSCNDNQACTTDVLTGTAAACTATCSHAAVTSCASSDGCCPSGCTNPSDLDCKPLCGDGIKNGTETCDGTGANKCPTTCNDSNVCTTDVLTGSGATCNVVCGHTAVTACVTADGCCAPGCNNVSDKDCAPTCGDGAKDGTETCDNSSTNDKCPTSCNDSNACTTDTTSGTAAACNLTCGHAAVTQCKNSDGCCAPGCTHSNDSDCPATVLCGDGIVGSGETCDGASCAAIIAGCADNNACTTDVVSGTAAACNVVCAHEAVTTCTSGDGCCAPGCANPADIDCAPTCGDGFKNGNETCDNSSANNKCPTSCDDANACTTDVLTGTTAACNVTCAHNAITVCANGDGCCAPGCSDLNDNSCTSHPVVCGDGRVEGSERCDGNCPTTCVDNNSCATDVLTGSASKCDVLCTNTPITTCDKNNADSCCGALCNANTDMDCVATCGNGAVEAGETCDNASPNAADKCPTSCNDGNACTTDTLSGDPSACKSKCVSTQIAVCVSGDGCCAPGCKNPSNGGNDADCLAAPTCGDGVLEASEPCDNSTSTKCPTTCDDTDPCTVDVTSGALITCNVKCSHSPIRSCTAGDRCCDPSLCNSNEDADCAPGCGNGSIETGELCDPDTNHAGANNKCPTAVSCNDGNPCTNDVIIGSGCQAVCDHTPTNAPACLCGNGLVDSGETCDGPLGCAALVAACNDGSDCTTDTLTGSAATCDVGCVHAPISTPTCLCGNGTVDPGETCDGNCPPSCPAGTNCAPMLLSGTPSACNVQCVSVPVTTCTNDDQCCPGGVTPAACDSTNDNDCQPLVDKCDLCEKVDHDGNANCRDATDACENLWGVTGAGSLRPGESKIALCHEALDCMHSSRCAKLVDGTSTPTDCLCGYGVDPNTCFNERTFADATGACKDILAAAAETTDMTALQFLFFDSTNACGAAEGVVEICDGVWCAKECL